MKMKVTFFKLERLQCSLSNSSVEIVQLFNDEQVLIKLKKSSYV